MLPATPLFLITAKDLKQASCEKGPQTDVGKRTSNRRPGKKANTAAVEALPTLMRVAPISSLSPATSPSPRAVSDLEQASWQHSRHLRPGPPRLGRAVNELWRWVMTRPQVKAQSLAATANVLTREAAEVLAVRQVQGHECRRRGSQLYMH